METKLLEKKLKKLATLYKNIYKKNRLGSKSIHKLRTCTREFLSYISREDPFYSKLKKVIKLTNEIRDIDVFQYEFLAQLPPKYKHNIDIYSLKELLVQQRNIHCEQLTSYLSNLQIPLDISLKELEIGQDSEFLEKVELTKLSKKELHKYRIYIKKKFYLYKAFYPQKKEQIKGLRKIKNYLGVINDNYNAKKRIVTLVLFNQKELLTYIKKENKKYLQKVIKLETIKSL